MKLRVEPGTYAACRLDAKARLPRWIHRGGFFSVTRTDDELSILCLQKNVPDGVKSERDWRLIKVLGTLDFSLIGVLASMAQPLADAQIGLLTVSTYDTDYLMVRSAKLEAAVETLESAGHRFETTDEESARKKTKSRTRQAKKESGSKSDSASRDEKKHHADGEKKGRRGHSRRRSEERKNQRRGRRRRSGRHGGSLYIGEDWEHIEAVSSEEAEGDESRDRKAEGAEKAEKKSQRTRTRQGRRRESSSEEARGEKTQREKTQREKTQREKTQREKTRPEEPRGEQKEPEQARAQEPEAQESEAHESEARESGSDTAEETSTVKRKRRRRTRSRRAERSDESRPQRGAEDEGPSTGRSEENRPGRSRSAEDAGEDDLPPAAVARPEDLPADEREVIDDEGDNSAGLYTGAIPQDPVETTEDTFSSLGLSERMVETLDEIGFVHPTPIQAAVLPMALEGSDIVGLAETGSGKTGAFGLPLAERLHHGRGVRGLILCPTREIALQTKAFLDIFGRDHELETAVVIGGVKFGPQISALKRHPDIIVATPGRLADHMRRGNVRLDKIEELVLDEADHMLDLGFLPQIQEIVSRVPRERRTMMFSATMPPTIERLAQRFLNDPYLADLRPVNRVAAGIEHRLYLVESGHERPCLIGLLEEVDDTTLVFARRKLDTEFLARQLQLAGLPAERIHSDRTQAQRVAALRGFREGKKRILVATDVAARGIDVPHLGHVINFGMPDTVEDYVHRAGRTARGKAVGIVSSIGTWQDKPTVKEIERTIGQSIDRCQVDGVPAYKELKPRRGRRRRRLL